MPVFTIGTPIQTDESQVTVDIDPNQPLAKGPHVFQLVVTDDDGLQSQPVQVRVTVADDRRPTAVLAAPATVQLGTSFILDGSRSVDAAPGQVVRYEWVLLR